MSLFDLNIKDIHNKLKNKEITATDLVNESFKRIDEVEKDVQAFISIDKEKSLNKAGEIDRTLVKSVNIGALTGLTVGITDNIITEGIVTTCGSKILENFKPVYSSSVYKRVLAGQSIIIGKTNMDEFGVGCSTECSSFHPTYNPWNLDFVPGGSSGGSAAAVAAGEVYYALGSDTGGGIRQPASFTGVVGLKPTYGLISRYGLIAYASSLDQIGPITKNVEDSAYVLKIIAGYDEMDSTSVEIEIPDYPSLLTGDIKGLKIGIAKEYLGQEIEPEVKEKIMDSIKVFEGLGAICEEVSLPHTEYASAAYQIISSAEISSNLARYDGVRYGYRTNSADNLIDMYMKTRGEGFGAEVKRSIMFGNYVLSSGNYETYYLKAQQVRTLIKKDFERVFEKYDLILGPTVPTTAFKIEENINNPISMYSSNILTTPSSLAGVPAISIPCGLLNELPVGLQLIGKYFDEKTILRASYAFEQSTDHHKLKAKCDRR